MRAIKIKTNGYQEDRVRLDEKTLRTFYTKQGMLTPYALSCGYIEKAEQGNIITTLWMEHGTIHVRQHDHSGEGRVFWESFETLTKARTRFLRALKAS